MTDDRTDIRPTESMMDEAGGLLSGAGLHYDQPTLEGRLRPEDDEPQAQAPAAVEAEQPQEPPAAKPDDARLQAEAQVKVQSEHLNRAATNLQREYQALQSYFASPEYQRLQQDNPQEAAAQRAQGQARVQQMQADWATFQQQGQQLQQQHYTTHLEAQRDKVLESLPEWRNEGIRNRELAQLRDWLSGQGYSQQEIDSVNDARAVTIAVRQMRRELNQQRKRPGDFKSKSGRRLTQAELKSRRSKLKGREFGGSGRRSTAEAVKRVSDILSGG